MKQGTAGLTLRELQVYHQPAVELASKPITAWVKQLPAANLGESSQSVYRLLVNANQTIVDPSIRLEVLNILEKVALKLVDSLERQYINNHIALTDKQRKIAALVQAIQTELSIGFHAVIEAILSEGVKRSTKKILAEAICNAIKYHGLVIYRCYQLYTSVPGRIWRELYRLYTIAKENDVQNQQLGKDKEHHISIKSSFMRVLLLSTGNPYQLKQNEIQLVWELLPNYIEYCTLEAHSYCKHPFYIDLNSHSAPKSKALYQAKEGEILLKISVMAAIEKIKIDLAQVTETGRYSAKKAMVYKHLIHCWSQDSQRSFARTGCEETIKVSIGLGATHYLLSEHLLAKQAQENSDEEDEPIITLDALEGSLKNATLSVVANKERESISSNRHYLSTAAITSKDVWAKLYRPDQAIHQECEENLVTKRSTDTIVRDSYKIQECTLVNMSPGGYCIQISSNLLPKHAQTSEIIGLIEEDGNGHHWGIGVVRWVRRQAQDNFIQMGVQLLAPNVIPISVQLRNSRSAENNFQRALMLPALTGVGQAATIITNPLAFNIKNKLRVMELTKEYDVRLTKEIANSGSSRQFGFEIISKESQKQPKPFIPRQENPEDMDGIWDLI
ncbi:MAG: hypothetical protein L3J46_01420 [Kangiellaceae bacterium]|nr:hypothetical protein [Kangiellaceae bacterium]